MSLGSICGPTLDAILVLGNGDAVDEPAGLMAAAHVQHVVGHVGAGDVVGDHLHADGSVGAGSLVDRRRG